MRFSAVLALIGVGLVASPCAWASPAVSGEIAFDQGVLHSDGDNFYTDLGSGSLLLSFANPGFNLQADGSGGVLRAYGESAELWAGALHGFWRDPKGAIGVSAGYGSMALGGESIRIGTYGAFGEWYARPDLTLRIKGGGLNVKDYGQTGGHVGAGAEYYIIPRLGISAEGEYASYSGQHFSSLGASIEFQFWSKLPMTLSTGYQYTQNGGGSNTGTLMVHLRYLFGVSGALVDLDRTGPLAWTGLI